MNELDTTTATPLIPVTDGIIGGRKCQVVDARTLHGYLECGRDFSNWIKGRIDRYNFVDGRDYSVNLDPPDLANQDRHGGDRRSKDYSFTLDTAKQLCMVENNAKGLEARRYFIECERKYHEMASGVAPVKPRRVVVSCHAGLLAEHKAALAFAKVKMQAARLYGMDAEMARAVVMEQVRRTIGVDDSPYLIGNHVKEVPVIPTELGKLCGLCAIDMNLRLAQAGFQVRDGKDWKATTQGEPFCTRNPYQSRNSEHTGYQLLWYPRVLEAMEMDSDQRPQQPITVLRSVSAQGSH
jgi:phage anti-repressor protein